MFNQGRLARRRGLLAAFKTSSSQTTCRSKHTHYDTLGIKTGATTKEVKSAFVELSKKFHPDKNPRDPKMHEKFVQINEAYSVLNSPSRRRAYDLSIQPRAQTRPHRPLKQPGRPYGRQPNVYNYEKHFYYHYRDGAFREQPDYEHYKKSRTANKKYTRADTGSRFQGQPVDDRMYPDDKFELNPQIMFASAMATFVLIIFMVAVTSGQREINAKGIKKYKPTE